MEKKSYNWLLFQLAQRNICLNILEVGICNRDKLLDWYCQDSNNCIHRNNVHPPTNLTKYLLNNFVSKRSPILGEYSPDKIVCYLYHKAGRKIVTVKEAAEMANNQLHGLHVLSLHMALSGAQSHMIYKVTSETNKYNELCTSITYNKFEKDNGRTLKDQEISDKIIRFTLSLCQALARFAKPIISLKLDLVITASGQIALIKANDLIFSKEMHSDKLRDYHKVPVFRLNESSDSLYEDYKDVSMVHYNESSSEEPEPHKFKIPLSKPVQSNSSVFLEMIAKTIQKKRKNKVVNDYFSLLAKDGKIAKPTIQRQSTVDFFRDTTVDGKLSTMNELLSYLERTRPKNWVQDNLKTSQLLIKCFGNARPKVLNRRGSLGSLPCEKPNTSNKRIHKKNSSVCFSSKDFSPVKLSHKHSASALPAISQHL